MILLRYAAKKFLEFFWLPTLIGLIFLLDKFRHYRVFVLFLPFYVIYFAWAEFRTLAPIYPVLLFSCLKSFEWLASGMGFSNEADPEDKDRLYFLVYIPSVDIILLMHYNRCVLYYSNLPILLALVFPLVVGLLKEFPRIKFRTLIREGDLLTMYILVRILPVGLIYFVFMLLNRDAGRISSGWVMYIAVFVYSQVAYFSSGKLIVRIQKRYNHQIYSEEWLMDQFLADMLYLCFIGILSVLVYSYSWY